MCLQKPLLLFLEARTIPFVQLSPSIKVTVLGKHSYFCLRARGGTGIYNKGELDIIDCKPGSESSLVTRPV